MVTFEELNRQNHKISELSQIVKHLIQDRQMCDMDTTCDIFMQFINKVNEHLKVVDTNVYDKLLTHSDTKVKHIASQFMNGSVEIKKIFQAYNRKWCANNRLRIKDHDKFVVETDEMMRLVLSRVQDKTEKLFPMVRKVNKDIAA